MDVNTLSAYLTRDSFAAFDHDGTAPGFLPRSVHEFELQSLDVDYLPDLLGSDDRSTKSTS